MSAKVISNISHKGGVGKTTTSTTITEILALLGKRILCVDLDPSSNCSKFFHAYKEDSVEVEKKRIPPEICDYNIAELFKFRYRNKTDVQKVIKKTNIKGVDIIPSSARHSNTARDVVLDTGNNNVILRRALNTIKDDYDYIVIDNAPAKDILTVNCLFASDDILVPVRLDRYSIDGLSEVLKDLFYIKEEHELDYLNFTGTFLTQVNTVTNIYKEVQKQMQTELRDKFFTTAIRSDSKVNVSGSKLIPLTSFPESIALMDYCRLLLETSILDQETSKLLLEIIS